MRLTIKGHWPVWFLSFESVILFMCWCLLSTNPSGNYIIYEYDNIENKILPHHYQILNTTTASVINQIRRHKLFGYSLKHSTVLLLNKFGHSNLSTTWQTSYMASVLIQVLFYAIYICLWFLTFRFHLPEAFKFSSYK